MIYTAPEIAGNLAAKLEQLNELRSALRSEVERPGRWMGSLRREVRASSIQGSTSIEGFSVEPGEAIALAGGAEAAGDDGNRMAVSCYARAMDHVGVMAEDPTFRWSDRVILDLHFDACYFQRSEDPGHWRRGPVVVTGPEGQVEYRGPDAEQVPGLMAEVVESLVGGDREIDVIVRAAIAHLNVISVHPFRDGNGRVSRIVQSLVLARERMLSPEFSSIEEYLGANTGAYYEALRETQAGSYQPDRDATGWVSFCVDAHFEQARQRLRQVDEAAARWDFLERQVADRGWPDRLVIALEQSLVGHADRTTYAEEANISTATASADFKRLLDSGLVEQTGKARSTRYLASQKLKADLGGRVATVRPSRAPPQVRRRE